MSDSAELASKEIQQVNEVNNDSVENKQIEEPFPTSRKLKCLVIDTNAIINGMSLRNMAEEFYTCPEVLYELRSDHSREFLSRLPFELKVINPTEEAIKQVTEFSKKTGDFGVLSGPDLRVLALTYTLELRENGDVNIRKEPLTTRPSGALPSAPPPKSFIKRVAVKQYDEDGWEIATNNKKIPTNAYKKKFSKNKKKAEPTSTEEETVEDSKEKTEEKVEESKEKAEEKVEESEIEKVTESIENVQIEEETPVTAQVVNEIPLTEDTDSDSDGGEWITPENVDEYKAAEIGVTPDELKKKEIMAVGCMTADFAMQNVLLQMNLNLVSAGGYRVKKIRNSVMRCHACFFVTNDLEKKFCSKCGNATLQRVTCSTNSKGEIAYHLKKNFEYKLRGTVYDIPPPKGGRKHNNIVLREDQRDYVKATQRKQKKSVVDLFDPDFIPLYGKIDTREVTNNMFGTDVIGFGRKNPNASKKRIGKKKRSPIF